MLRGVRAYGVALGLRRMVNSSPRFPSPRNSSKNFCLISLGIALSISIGSLGGGVPLIAGSPSKLFLRSWMTNTCCCQPVGEGCQEVT